MFWKRKPKTAPGGDPEMERLRAQLARRQEEAVELEQELFDLRRFVAEVETHLAPLQRRVEALRAQLARARGAGDRDATYHASSAAPPPPPPQPESAPFDEAELKALYRALAKRFHPDLAADPAEKDRRQSLMAEVNTVYAARDLAALRALAARPEAAPAENATSRDQLMAEIERLDGVIADLERRLDELSHSPAVQLKLEVSLARHAGHNLLGQIAADLQAEITRLEDELAARRRR